MTRILCCLFCRASRGGFLGRGALSRGLGRPRGDADLFQRLLLGTQRDLGDFEILRRPIVHRGERGLLMLCGLLRLIGLVVFFNLAPFGGELVRVVAKAGEQARRGGFPLSNQSLTPPAP